MYAIRVLLTPSLLDSPADEAAVSRALDVLPVLVGAAARPGVAHVTIRPFRAGIAAMTFVEAANLRCAERLAIDAWDSWLSDEAMDGWAVETGEADFLLGVWAIDGSGVSPGE